jgi:hypothetical protein
MKTLISMSSSWRTFIGILLYVLTGKKRRAAYIGVPLPLTKPRIYNGLPDYHLEHRISELNGLFLKSSMLTAEKLKQSQ